MSRDPLLNAGLFFSLLETKAVIYVGGCPLCRPTFFFFFLLDTEKRVPPTSRFHRRAVKREGRGVSAEGKRRWILLLRHTEAAEGKTTPLLLEPRPRQTMIEACGAQECPYCRHGRKSGLRAHLSVALSPRQCVSMPVTDRTVGKVAVQTASIVRRRCGSAH